MDFVRALANKFDSQQRQHAWVGFPYAVIKKYGDDDAGYQAALLTYYGFLSLFPLLLVLTTLLGVLAGNHPHLRTIILNGTTHYFPTLGNQLAEHIGSLHKTGLALGIGLLFTLYGARGIADAFRHGVYHIWYVPKTKRPGFPFGAARSVAIVLIGGAGFILAAIIAGYAAAAGHGIGFHLLSVAIDLALLFGVFLFLIKVSLPIHVTLRQIESGAAAAAVGLVALQNIGSYVLTHEVKNLSALYSNFAVVLGLLFWIYLQAQMVYYALEIAAVRSQDLWPRSFTGRDLTEADKQVHDRLFKQIQATGEQKTPKLV